jgi:hypothetical protein
VRFHPRTNAAFIGDAKETETPSNTETQSRLLRYMEWIANPTIFRHGSIFAVCFGRPLDRFQWQCVLKQLASKAGLKPITLSCVEVAEIDHVASLFL